MTVVTYSADPTWEPRYVLAVATPEGLRVREDELSEAQLHSPALVLDARDKLRELRAMTSAARLAEWVRWKGLCVGIEDTAGTDADSLLATPLPPRLDRAAYAS